jgi:putative salt-induced outer membrane protein YdiY
MSIVAIRTLWRCCLWILLVLTSGSGPVSADELQLRDGSNIFGTIIKKNNGVLEFKTSYAGTIKVKWTEIKEIRADKPFKVILDNDDILMATAIRNTADVVTLITGTQTEPAPVELAQSNIALINPEPWRLGKGHKFSGRANLAVERERGNTDTNELDLDFDLTYRRRMDRFVAYGELEKDRDNERDKDRMTADNWLLTGRYHHFITRKWFIGGGLSLDADYKADREFRAVAGPLVGYQFIESQPMNFRTELGIVGVHEEFKNQRDVDYTAGAWDINFDKYLLDEFMQFYHHQIGVLSFEDASDLIWNTWTGFRFPLVYGFIASTELQTEYDGGATKDADNLDTTYLLKLGYAW